MQELLKHFHELSLHPKNAKKLKGLILQLAIQGKLTADWRTQNPEFISGDNSAENLLKEIKVEKAKLVKEKKIKKEKALPPITGDEVPYKLPEGWVWTKLGEVSSLINGDRGKNYPSKAHYIAEGIPFVTARNLGDRFLKHDALNYISEERFHLLRSGHIKLNDILYCLRGSLGKCCIVEGIEKGAIASSLVIVRPTESLDSIFLLNYFLSPLGKGMIYKYDNGTAQPNLSATDVKKYFLPLAPLKEQKVIAKTVGTLFKEVEALGNLTKKRIELKKDYVTSALNQLAKNDSTAEWKVLKPQFHRFFNEVDNIKKLRETILQLAVQGKLTAKWRAENPELISDENSAENLLKEVKTVKSKLIKEKKIKKEKALPPIAEEEIPYELPEGWVWCKIGDLFEVKSSKRVFKSDYVKEGVPFFRSKEIGQLGRGQKITSELYISKNKFETLKKNYGVCKPNDVLIACIGGSIGNTWLVDDREFYYKDGNLVQLSPWERIDSRFLLNYLNSQTFYQSALGNVSGSAYNALTIIKIKNSLFPLPCFEEQKAVTRKLNELMSLCDQLELEVENEKQQIENLMQSVLKEIFEGEKEINEISAF